MIEKFRVKTKTHNFGTKNAVLSIFDQQCLIWAFLAKNIQGNYYHNWNLHHQIAKFCEKTKIPSFGTNNAICVMRCLIKTFPKKTKSHKFREKNALFSYFLGRIFKNCCHIWNQHPQTSMIAKFCVKTKRWLGGYFWPRIPYLKILGQELNRRPFS